MYYLALSPVPAQHVAGKWYINQCINLVQGDNRGVVPGEPQTNLLRKRKREVFTAADSTPIKPAYRTPGGTPKWGVFASCDPVNFWTERVVQKKTIASFESRKG